MTKKQHPNEADLADESSKFEAEVDMSNSTVDGGVAPKKVADEIEWLPIGELELDENQARKYFDREQVEQLAQSLKSHSMIEAIIYREDNGRKIVVAGDRRLRAAKIAELDKVPCRKFNGDPGDADLVGLIDNMAREPLLPMEEALAIEKLKKDKGYTQAKLGKELGKSQNTISDILSLAKLPDYIREEALKSHKWSRGILLRLSKKEDEKEQRAEFTKIKNRFNKTESKSEDKPENIGMNKRDLRTFNASKKISITLYNQLSKISEIDHTKIASIPEIEKNSFTKELEELKKAIETCIKNLRVSKL